MPKKLTTDIFIERAKIIHNDKYDYTLSVYTGAHKKILITCKHHGDFLQSPDHHLRGRGCVLCGPDKHRETCQANYGVDNPLQSSIIKQKHRETCQANYGVDNPLQSSIIKQRIKELHIKNHNVPHQSQKHLTLQTIELMNSVNFLSEQHHDNKFTVFKIAEILGVNHSALCAKFNKFNIKILRFKQSQGERDICKILTDCNIAFICNARDIIPPLELDIFLPDYNIAIEFNGVYWHSELQGINSKYHLTKTLRCKQLNIRLIHIFDSEWQIHSDIVRSRILSILQKNSTIFARKSKIVSVSNSKAIEFFNNTHIQGYTSAKINLGLEYNNELVAVMSFGKSRFNKHVEWELIRYSNKLNYSVVGGAGKLFNNFIKNYDPTSVISYSDKRWNTGELYLQLGFKYSHSSSPNYFYFNINYPNTLISRQQFQKHKLKNILEVFDENLSEWQNMINNNYDRIWDCGNDVFIWKVN
jgi:hypothetical protein